MHRLMTATALIAFAALAAIPGHAGEAEITLKHPTFTAVQWAPGLVSQNVQVRGDVPHAAQGSGLPTGKRQHKPISITKPVDKASPMLARALETGTALPQIMLMGRDAEGRAVTVRLENVRVTNIAPLPQQPAAGKPKPKPKPKPSGDIVPTETISLNFAK